MNCKPGDLALITVSRGPNSGKMVECIRLVTMEEFREALAHIAPPHISVKDYGPIWQIDRPITWWAPSINVKQEAHFCPDKVLMPIRPDAEPVDERRQQEEPA